MKIYSLLPSSTELIYALGAEAELAGVGPGCDYPPEVAKLPVMSLPRRSPQQDHAAADGSPPEKTIRQEPVLVISQDLCDICGPVRTEVDQGFEGTHVLALRPHSLSDVIENIGRVGCAVGRVAEAAQLMAALQGRVEEVRDAAATHARPRPSVLCLNWLSPPFAAGYCGGGDDRAGGRCVLVCSAVRTRTATHLGAGARCRSTHSGADALRQHLAEALMTFAATVLPARWAELRAVRENRVFAVDAKAYFSVPGPRVVDGLEILSAVVKGTGFEKLPEAGCVRVPA